MRITHKQSAPVGPNSGRLAGDGGHATLMQARPMPIFNPVN